MPRVMGMMGLAAVLVMLGLVMRMSVLMGAMEAVMHRVLMTGGAAMLAGLGMLLALGVRI